MDNYTKMMDAALKQGLIKWEWQHGDRLYCATFEIEMFFGYKRSSDIDPEHEVFYSTKDAGPWPLRKAVPLPTIEQLMGMVDTDFVLERINNNYYYNSDTTENAFIGGKTPTEALIQGVIHENHNLRWSQEKGEWIKQK